MSCIDFKYCKNCQYCKSLYKKGSTGNCIMQYFVCVVNYESCENVSNVFKWPQETFVYPNILKHQIETPSKCPFYVEMCLNSWKNEERKNVIQRNLD